MDIGNTLYCLKKNFIECTTKEALGFGINCYFGGRKKLDECELFIFKKKTEAPTVLKCWGFLFIR
jgi:hypothetical protein